MSLSTQVLEKQLPPGCGKGPTAQAEAGWSRWQVRRVRGVLWRDGAGILTWDAWEQATFGAEGGNWLGLASSPTVDCDSVSLKWDLHPHPRQWRK